MKKLFLIGSPPASGKTYVAKKLAGLLSQPVYLDKDAIIPLSKVIYEIAHEPYNRDSEFFNTYIRDAEYEAIMAVALEALMFNQQVIVNAPFSKEIRGSMYLMKLKEKLRALDAEVIVIWVHSELDLIHQRMIARNSDRDKWKIENWEAYVKARDFSIPQLADMYVIENTDEASVMKQLQKIIKDILCIRWQ
ncbi:MAG: AAA family ATPase [Cellulosilyticaceae bacterium]